MSTGDTIAAHYVQSDTLIAKVAAVLDTLTPAELEAASAAGFDQFHVRGIAATADLAKLARIDAATDVLDAGSGFGGPARYLATTYGCRVRGIDLTPAFVAVATLLAERTGCSNRATFETGDLAALPFEDASFDLIWTQHVVMNVPDRNRVYQEFRRVLRPGGRIAFYDVVAGDGAGDPVYPMPWAETPSQSFLMNKAQTVAAFEHAGFAIITWHDVTEEAIASFTRAPAPTPQGLSLATLMGERFGPMTANLAQNLREGKLCIAMGIAT